MREDIKRNTVVAGLFHPSHRLSRQVVSGPATVGLDERQQRHITATPKLGLAVRPAAFHLTIKNDAAPASPHAIPPQAPVSQPERKDRAKDLSGNGPQAGLAAFLVKDIAPLF